MQYREFKPAPALSGYVECFWLLQGEAAPAAAPERLLPDGCVELILNLGARFREFDATGRSALQPACLVVGQMTCPVRVAPTGAVELLGIRFAPGGTLPFLPVAPGELTDRVTPLDAITTALERELTEALETADAWRARLARLEATLIRRLYAANLRNTLQPALTQLLKSGGQISVDRLAADCGLSMRQLERRFVREVGLGPKLLSRILRFQQVFRAVESESTDWADVAVACGYYDQAHLIRDFRQFAGQTPAVLFDDFSQLTELFTRKRRTSYFSNTRC